MNHPLRNGVLFSALFVAVLLAGLITGGCTTDDGSAQSREEATAEGREAYRTGDYETAFEELYPVARAGDPLSEFYIARMYHFGEGREKDIDKAIEWYMRSAKAGAAPAQYQLGRIYHSEERFEEREKAIEWYVKAARNNWVPAMNNLSLIYEDVGDGTRAFEWKKRAAEEGSARAQFGLGYYYDKGIFVDTDSEKAREYYLQSARQGYASAMVNLAVLHDEGVIGERDLKEVYKWFLLAFQQGRKELKEELNKLKRALSGQELRKADVMAGEFRRRYLADK